jgi:hypothetical protein
VSGITAGGSETGMQGTASDTAAMTATDSSRMGTGADTGMKTDTGRTKVTKTRPDQNQPVTSKGDTISNRADTSASAPK